MFESGRSEFRPRQPAFGNAPFSSASSVILTVPICAGRADFSIQRFAISVSATCMLSSTSIARPRKSSLGLRLARQSCSPSGQSRMGSWSPFAPRKCENCELGFHSPKRTSCRLEAYTTGGAAAVNFISLPSGFTTTVNGTLCLCFLRDLCGSKFGCGRRPHC